MGSGSTFEQTSDKLTSKQREVLDLLIKHKTSKEIARILGISPYTVDQRITAARRKFGASSRNELAEVYQRQADISQEPIYQSSYVANEDAGQQNDERNEARLPRSEIAPNPIYPSDQSDQRYHRVVPEIFDGPYRIWARLLAIGLLSIMLLMIVLGGLAAFAQLSDVLS